MMCKATEGTLDLKYKQHKQGEATTLRQAKWIPRRGQFYRGEAVLEITRIFQIVPSVSDCLIALLAP